MLVARRYLIQGLVQGVGFRFFVKNVAQNENVNGFVRNLSDGRVEIMVEGLLEAVDRFEKSIRQGPEGARVDGIDSEKRSIGGQYLGFSIRTG